MLFLNMWLLLGLLGISIPVIIHLLNRRHAKKIDWGAMSFLMDSLITRRRRVLLEEILLLATRCLLIGLVALALARPFVSANSNVPWMLVLPAALLAIVLFGISFALWRYPVWRRCVLLLGLVLVGLSVAAVLFERQLNLKRFGGLGARDVALVIDGSSSMTMTVDGEPNFARALKEAETYIESAPRGFSFSLIIGGSVPNVLVPAPTPDRGRLKDVLREARPVQGTMQALDTLAVAATTLARGDRPGKQVVMIGDGQSVGWRTGEADLWAYLQEAFTRFAAPPQVIWRRLPMPQTVRNATLSNVELSRQVVGTDRDVRIDVTIANTGGEGITPQEVRLTVGEKVLTDHSLELLQPGASATVSFNHRFEQAGAEVVKAAVEAKDEMSGDDEAVHVVHIMDQLKVQVVDAATTTTFLDRPGAFVTLALMPDLQRIASKTDEAKERDFLVQPELQSLFDLTEAGEVDAGVVVLVDIPQLPSVLAKRLADFVEQGGGLLVIAGGRANASFYNGWSGGSGPLMPLSLAVLMEPSETNRPALDLKTFEHKAMKPLRSSDLEAARFNRYWKSKTEVTGETQIGARFAHGEPFMAERKYGRGTVLQVNAPLDGTAGNLVVRQGFLPLVHELVYHLARPVAADLNLPPSRGATLQLGVATSGKAGGGGLRGEYYNHFSKTSGGVVRVDPTVSSRLAWPGAAPNEDTGFWVRWTGSIAVPTTGLYVFETVPADLLININGHQISKSDHKRAEVEFERGRRYDFEVEFRCPPKSDSRRVSLDMSGPGLELQPIPSAFLSPEKASRDKSDLVGIETTVIGPAQQMMSGHYVTGGDGSIALRIDENLVPGLYEADVPPALLASVKPLLNGAGHILFGVKVDGEESRLAPLSPEETAFIAKYVNFLAAGSAEDVLSAFVGKSFGRELWRSLAMAAFILLLIEVALTRWIAIQRRAGEPTEEIRFEDANKPSSEFHSQLDNLKTGGG